MPLVQQAWGNRDQDTVGPSPGHQLQHAQTRFDGFSQTNVVGNEETRARLRQDSADWGDLISLQGYTPESRSRKQPFFGNRCQVERLVSPTPGANRSEETEVKAQNFRRERKEVFRGDDNRERFEV